MTLVDSVFSIQARMFGLHRHRMGTGVHENKGQRLFLAVAEYIVRLCAAPVLMLTVLICCVIPPVFAIDYLFMMLYEVSRKYYEPDPHKDSMTPAMEYIRKRAAEL